MKKGEKVNVGEEKDTSSRRVGKLILGELKKTKKVSSPACSSPSPLDVLEAVIGSPRTPSPGGTPRFISGVATPETPLQDFDAACESVEHTATERLLNALG